MWGIPKMTNNQDNNPSSTLSYEAFLEALPGYVLGALAPDELLAVDDYLRTHPDLYERLESLEATAAQLAYAAPQAPLPNHIRDRVVARARTSIEEGASQPNRIIAPQADTIREQDRVVQPSPLDRIQSLRPRRRPGRHLQPVPRPATPHPQPRWSSGTIAWPIAGIATAAALLLVVLFSRNLATVESFRMQLDSVQQRVAALRAENTALRQDNAALQNELQAQQNQMAALANPDRSIALISQQGAPISGHIYITQRTGLLILNGLSPLPQDQAYELWLIPDGGTPISAGLVPSDNQATIVWESTLPLRFDQFALVGLSVEPQGGSPELGPTGPIILLSNPT